MFISNSAPVLKLGVSATASSAADLEAEGLEAAYPFPAAVRTRGGPGVTVIPSPPRKRLTEESFLLPGLQMRRLFGKRNKF